MEFENVALMLFSIIELIMLIGIPIYLSLLLSPWFLSMYLFFLPLAIIPLWMMKETLKEEEEDEDESRIN